MDTGVTEASGDRRHRANDRHYSGAAPQSMCGVNGQVVVLAVAIGGPRWWPSKVLALVLLSAGGAVGEPVAVAGGGDDVGVVAEPVEQRHGGGLVGQEASPVLEW